MLSKKYRLPIQHLPSKKADNIKKTSVLTIKIFKSDLSYPRFGIIISGKIYKSAVKRNQLRRAFFNFVRDNFDSFKPADYLVIINKKEISKEELIENLKYV